MRWVRKACDTAPRSVSSRRKKIRVRRQEDREASFPAERGGGIVIVAKEKFLSGPEGRTLSKAAERKRGLLKE